jgi:hypothetical protein
VMSSQRVFDAAAHERRRKSDVFLRDPVHMGRSDVTHRVDEGGVLVDRRPIAADPHDSDPDDPVTNEGREPRSFKIHDGEQGLLSATAFRASPTSA